MGLFNFGGSRSSSRSSGRSSSLDFSRSDSRSGGFSESGSGASQRVAFEDVFARLFGGAEGAATGLDPSIVTDTANQLFNTGTDFLNGLGGDAGSDYLDRRLSGAESNVDEQIALLGEDIGRFFSEEINPAISSEAIAAGGFGGGRQGVAQGIAAARAGEEFRRGAAAIRAGDVAARDRIAEGVSRTDLERRGLGLSAMPSLLGLRETAFSAGLQPYERLASILGAPTVLGESSSFSTAADFARAWSESFGRSESRTDSRSSGGSISFGFN